MTKYDKYITNKIVVILGICFVVIIILFSAYTLRSGMNLTDSIKDQLKKQILEDCKSGNSKIVLYECNFDKPALTPLAIKNLREDDEFKLSIEETSGYNIDADKIFFYTREPVFVKSNECELVSIKVVIPSDLPKNFYIFDLKIENSKGFYDSRELSINLQ